VYRDGQEIEVDLKLSIGVAGDRIHFDYSGCGPQVGSALNLPPAMMTGTTVIALLGLLGGMDSSGMNSGLLEPISMTIPEGSVLHPSFPAAVGGRAQIASRIMDLANECLSHAIPGVVPAQGEGSPGAFFFNPDVIPGRDGGVLTEIYVSGWGARPDQDGIDGVMSMVMSGFRTASAEVIESEFPIALEGFGFMPDSGGPGRFRGTLSVFRRWRFTRDGHVLIRDVRSDAPAPGRAGGGAGGPSAVTRTVEGVESTLPRQTMIDVRVQAHDVMQHVLPGGGGFGNPLERDLELVLSDILDGKVSVEHAEAVYGVTLSPDGESVDVEATEARRNAR
jgi:N-methylhydantoinase B